MMRLETPLDELTLAFLDVETTGLCPHFGDRICEIAVLRTRGQEVLDSFQSLVNPQRPISPGASAVNGLTDEMVRDAPLFKEVAGPVLTMLENAVIVAHNAPFDLGFLAHELALLRLPPPDNPVLDTLALARRCYRFPSNSLSYLAWALGIRREEWPQGPWRGEGERRGRSIEAPHRALGDVLTTWGVFQRFRQDLAARGAHTLGDFLRLQGGHIALPTRQEFPLPPQLEEAVRSGRRLWLRYVSAWGRETVRLVSPLGVTASGGRLYLVAFCHLRGAQRTFRLDRIVEMRLE